MQRQGNPDVNLRMLGIDRPMVGVSHNPRTVEVDRAILGPSPCSDCGDLLVYVEDNHGGRVWVDRGDGIVDTALRHNCRGRESSR